MRLLDLGSILVAVIAALGAWAAQRAAARASKVNTIVSGRLEAEKEAYERARAFDIQTIERQTKEIQQLREDNQKLRTELLVIKRRVYNLEHLSPELERLLRERIDEPDDQE